MTAEADLIQDLAELSADPYRFVLWAFPWGEPGTELEDRPGPEEWQADLLRAIRDGLLSPHEAIQIAVASGHGIGKSALVAWIIIWSISTFEDTRGVVTANTETQLKTKTWAELGKWFRLFIASHLFKLTATSIYSPDRERSWRIDMVPWSERSTEAFAGLHNQGKRVVLIMDEAAAIPGVIWETSEGALTDENTQILWLVFGNPTRNSGRFKECFGRFRHRWLTRQVDSRSVSFTNKTQIAKWIQDYGDDSDFVRVRVKGEFPRAGTMQFISSEIVEDAARREVAAHRHDALVIGVDVARFGDDSTVILPRKGRDARSFPALVLRGADTMTVAGRVAEEAMRLRADAVFVDETGVGGGVVDRLRQLNISCFGINFSSKPDGLMISDEPDVTYANKRAEIWGLMRDWLKGGAIPDESSIREELTGPEYGYNIRNAIQLESKDDMKRRGLASPDWADALALTFSLPVAPNLMAGNFPELQGPQVAIDYDPLAYAEVA